MPNFAELAARYSRSGNPLFIPECAGDIHGAANAFYAIGQFKAVGYSSMGIGELQRLTAFRAGDAPPAPPADVENLPLPLAYATLSQLAPLVLDHQAKGAIAAAWLNKDNPDTEIKLGGYILHVSLWGWGRHSYSDVPIGYGSGDLKKFDAVPDLMGYGLFMPTGPDEFLMAGDNVLVTFTPDPPGPEFVALAEQSGGPLRERPMGGHAVSGRRRLDAAARPRQRRRHGPVGLRRAAIFATAPFVRRARHPARESVPVQVAGTGGRTAGATCRVAAGWGRAEAIYKPPASSSRKYFSATARPLA